MGGTGVRVLESALDELDLAVDRDELVAALRVRDRLDLRLTSAVAAFDEAEQWDDDGATSMTRWLVAECGMSDAAARRLVVTAARLAAWPVLAAALADGTVSAGQVEVVVAKVRPRHVALFAEHEEVLVPAFALLDVDATVTAMNDWADKADAVDEGGEPPEPRSRLHHGKVGARGRLDADLAGDGYAIVAEALRMAGRHDDESDGTRRTRAERDADAFIDLCARLLRLEDTPKGRPGRQRPGVNLVIEAPALAALELRELGVGTQLDLEELLAEQPTNAATRAWYQAGLDRLHLRRRVAATTLAGHELSPALAAAFLCDATMRRVVTAGSEVLEYGHAHPTLPRAIREAVVLRDRTCRFRGCRRTVDWCEVHHLRHRAQGGADRVTNCVLLCARHHHVLHRDGWVSTLAPDGTLSVVTPTGRRWHTRPPGPGNGPPPPDRLTLGA